MSRLSASGTARILSIFFRGRPTALFVSAVLFIAILPAAASAQTNLYWDPNGLGTDGSATWDTSSLFWSPNSAGGGSDQAWNNSTSYIANFGYSSDSSSNTWNISLATSISATGIDFNTDAGAFTFAGTGSPTLTLGGSGITVAATDGTETFGSSLAIALSASQIWTNNSTVSNELLSVASNVSLSNSGAQTLSIAGAGNTTLGGIIANGSGTLTLGQTGSGTLTLTGPNTYTGGTSVSAGVLRVNNTSGSGTGSGTVTVTGGTLTGTGFIQGAVTISNTANSVLSVTSGSTLSIDTGGSATITGLTLAGSSSFLDVTLGGTPTTPAAPPLSVVGLIAPNSAKVTITGTPVGGASNVPNIYTLATYTGAALTPTINGISGLTLSSPTANGNNLLLVPGVSSVDLMVSSLPVVYLTAQDTGTGTSFNVAGHWSNAAAPSSGNSYYAAGTGPGIGAAGIIRTPASAGDFVFAGNSLTLGEYGVIYLKGVAGTNFTATINSLILDGGTIYQGNTGINTVPTLAGAIYLAGNSFIEGGGQSASYLMTVASNISGPGGLSFYAPGIETVSGANTYTGYTLVGSSTGGPTSPITGAGASTIVSAGSTGAIPSTSAVNVLSGSTLELSGFSLGIGSLTGAGAVTNNSSTAATLTVGNDNTSPAAFSGGISTTTGSSTGALSLTKVGTGTLTLSGVSTYTGATTINDGTLQLNLDNNAAGELSGNTSGITVNSGGTLALNAGDALGYTTGVNPLTINSGGTVTNITSASRVTIDSLLTMTGGTLTGTGVGDVNGPYSFDDGTAGITATSDSNGNPSVINVPFTLQSGNLVLNVSRGSASPASDMNITGKIYEYSTSTGLGIIKSGNGILTLSGANTFTGGLTIQNGTIVASTSVDALGGTGTGTVTLGNTTGTNPATLLVGSTGLTYADPIVLPTNTSVGTLTIGNIGTAISTTFSGGVTGGNSFTINENATTGGVTFQTGSINNAGTVTNAGAGSGSTTISSVIGINVTGLIQNSSTSNLVLTNANTFTGGTTIDAGALLARNTTGSAVGTGAVTVQNGGILGGSGILGTTGSPVAVSLVSSGSTSATNGHLDPGYGLTGTSVATLTINGSLTLSANSFLDYRLGPATTAGGTANDFTTVSGALTLPSSGTLNVTQVAAGAALAAGNYTLITSTSAPTYTSLSGWTINISNDAYSAVHTYGLQVIGDSLDLTVGLSALTWTGLPGGGGSLNNSGTANQWDSTSYNWSNPSNAAAQFTTGQPVTFADSYTVSGGNSGGSPSGTVNIQSGGVQPLLVSFTNASTSYVFSNVGGDTSSSSGINGSASVSITGGGTVTFNGQNTYTGGTTLSAGTLNINNAGTSSTSSAIGSGTLAVYGGKIDNTSGGPITLASNNPVSLGGNFAFGGTGSLNLGTGAVSLNIASPTITLGGTSSTLTFGGALTNNVAGANTVTVNGTGNTLVLGGYVLENNGTSAVTDVINGTGNVNISGAITNGTASAGGLTYSGTGMLTLSGANTYTGITSVTNGTLSVSALGNTGETSSSVGAAVGANRTITLGGTASATLIYTGAATSTDHLISLGNAVTIDSSGSGELILTGGTTGAHSITFGGTQIGEETGVINSTAGTIQITSPSNTWIFTGANTYTDPTSINSGTLQIGNGTATNALPNTAVTDNGNLTFDVSANATVGNTISGSGTLRLIPANTATISLTATGSSYSGATTIDGGILNVGALAAGGSNSSIGAAAVSAGNLVFGGGTFQYTGAAAASTNRLLTIGDANGNAATLDSSSATTAGTLSFTGTGAVGFANAVPHTLTFTGSNTGLNSFAPILGDQSGGNATTVIKNGTGTWGLAGANTYSGGTTINAGGLLAENTTSSAFGTGPVTIQTGGSLGGSGIIGANVSTVSTGSTAATNGHLAPGYGLTGTSVASLTIDGNLTLAANSFLDYRLGTTTSVGDFTSVSGSLTLPSVATLNVSQVVNGGGLAAGNYTLITSASAPTYTSFTGWTINVTGDAYSASHTYSLGVIGDSLDLTVNLAAITWTGVPGGGGTPNTGTPGQWDTTSYNWSGGGNAVVQFSTGSAVTFADTYSVAGGNSGGMPSSAVSIQSGGVQPSLVIFSNSASGTSYVFSNVGGDTGSTSGISGNASVSISGGGTVTFNGQNTYTGGTSLSLGTLNINNAGTSSSSSAIGSGTLTLSGGTIDNTSGAPIILASNNPVTIAGSFAFGATNNLNLGTGAVSITVPSATITLGGTSSTLTFGGGLTNNVAGAATLTVNGSGNTLVGGGYVLENSGSSPAADVINGNATVNISGAITNGTSSGSSLTYSGTGTLLLSGTGSTGGITVNSGLVQLNNVGALGSGSVGLNGGTIDNTSGSPMALSSNNPVTIGGGFTFGGTNNLTFGTGVVSLTVASPTIALGGTSSTLAFGGALTNNVAGADTVTVNGTGNTFSVGGYVLENSGTTAQQDVINGSGNVTIAGAITNGTATGSGLAYSGTGTLRLTTGTSTYTGLTSLTTGTMVIGGSASISATDGFSDNGALIIASSAATPLDIANTGSNFYLGGAGSGTAGGTGLMYVGPAVTGTVELTSGNNFTIGNGAGGIATGNVFQENGSVICATTGNAVTSGFYIGVNGGTATYNISGGSLTAQTETFFIAGNAANSTGTLNINGGKVTAVNAFNLGDTNGNIGPDSATINLNAGTLQTPGWTVSTGTGVTATLNFNGGTLQANAASTTFLGAGTTVNIFAGGATIDTQANNITVAKNLGNAPNSAVAVAVTTPDTSTVFTTPPALTIAGGASGYATLDSNGHISGIVLTNAGSYTSAPSASITGSSEVLSTSLVANSGGGLTKLGSGTLTLSGTNTYAGPTTISAGTLALSNASGNNIASSASLRIAGGAFLNATGLTAGTFTLGSGAAAQTLSAPSSGVGTVTGSLSVFGTGSGGGTLAVTSGGTLATSSGLTFASGSIVDFALPSSPNPSTPLISVGGALTPATSGNTLINITYTNLNPGTYDLIGAASGLASTSGFVLDTSAPGGASWSLSAQSNQLDLVVVEPMTWTGANSGGAPNSSWDTTSGSTNWAGGSPAVATQYFDGTAVTFGDTNPIPPTSPISNSTVVVQAAGVNPASVTFTNTGAAHGGVDYSFSNAVVDSVVSTVGISGSTGVTLAGTDGVGGNVTFNSPNTYTGPTTISAGALILGDRNAVQSSTVSVGVNGGLQFASGLASANLGGLAGTGNVALTNAGSSAVVLNVGGNGGATTYSGVLSGAGSLNLVGGTLTLASANSYNGGTTITGGTLRAGIVDALPTGGTVTFNAQSTPGTLDLNGYGLTVGGLAVQSGASAANQIITNSNGSGNGATATLTYNGGTSSFGGILQDGGSGKLALTVAGGSLTLSGANGYTGATQVNAGTLRVTGSLTSPTGVINIGGTSATEVSTSGSTGGTPSLVGSGTIAGSVEIFGNTDGSSPGHLAPSGFSGSPPTFLNIGGNLTLDPGAVLDFYLSGTPDSSGTSGPATASGNNDYAKVTGSLISSGGGTLNINDPNGLSTGTYVLATYGSGTPTAAGWNYTLTTPVAGLSLNFSSANAGQFDLVVTAGNASASWAHDGSGPFSFDTASYWSGSTIPSGAGLVATFGNSGLTSSGITVDVGSSDVVGGLIFNNSSPTSYTLSSTGGSLTLNNNGNGPSVTVSSTHYPVISAPLTLADGNGKTTTFNVASGSYIEVSGAIGETTSSGQKILLTGGGTLQLDNAANTYTGGTTVSGGILTLDPMSGPATPLGSGALAINGSSSVVNVSPLNPVTVTVGSLSGTGGGTLNIAPSASLAVNQTTTSTFNGTLLLNGGLVLAGSSGNTLTINGTPSIAAGSSIMVNSGALALINNGSAASAGAATATVASAATLQLAGPANVLSSAVNIMTQGSGSANDGAVSVVGASTQTVGVISGQVVSSSPTTYSGNTTVGDGTNAANLTATQILQNTLTINAGSTVTIAPSGSGIPAVEVAATPAAVSGVALAAGSSDSSIATADSDSNSDPFTAIEAAISSGSINAAKGEQLENRIAAIERLTATDPGLDASLLEDRVLAALPTPSVWSSSGASPLIDASSGLLAVDGGTIGSSSGSALGGAAAFAPAADFGGSPAAVPEPSTLLLAVFGGVGVMIAIRRRSICRD